MREWWVKMYRAHGANRGREDEGKIGRLKLAECEKEKWRKLLDITAWPLWSVGSAHALHQTGLERYFRVRASPRLSLQRSICSVGK